MILASPGPPHLDHIWGSRIDSCLQVLLFLTKLWLLWYFWHFQDKLAPSAILLGDFWHFQEKLAPSAISRGSDAEKEAKNSTQIIRKSPTVYRFLYFFTTYDFYEIFHFQLNGFHKSNHFFSLKLISVWRYYSYIHPMKIELTCGE